MSFPRAKVKRFNEQQGCAPPPGHYNMPDPRHSTGVLPFETGGERFKQDSDSSSDTVSELSCQLSTTFLTPNQPPSKKKLNFTAPEQNKTNTSGKSTPHPSPAISNKEKQEYEKEIRRLIQQVNEQDRKLSFKTQEIQKFENRLSLISKEKSSLIAQVATVEKKVTELQRRNAILQSQKSTEVERQHKREGLEDEVKKTRSKLETAKQELDKCRSLLVALQSDLESARSTISALRQSNILLTQLNKEVQAHSDDVSTQVTKLQSLADNLRSEKVSSEEQLSLLKEKFKNVEKNFTKLLQEKAKDIEQQFEVKQELILKKLDGARSELQESNTKTEELQKIIANLENEKKQNDEENEKVEGKLEIALEQIEQLTEIIRELKAAVEISETKILAAEQDKSALEKKVQNLETEIGRVTDESQQAVEALKNELMAATEEREKALSSTEEARTVIQQLEIEKGDLDKRIKELETENEEVMTKYEESMAQEKETEMELESLKSTLKAAENDSKTVASKLDSHLFELEELRRNKRDLTLKLEKTQDGENECKEQIELLDAKADALETQLMTVSRNASRANENEESANQRIAHLEEQMKERETQYQAKLSEFTRRLLETQKKLNHKQEELQSLLDTNELGVTEMRKLRRLLEDQTRNLQDADGLKKENTSLSEKVTKLQNQISLAKQEKRKVVEIDNSNSEELNMWKDRYNKLWEKVEPFQGQIDAYAAEKASLLCENSAANAEMQALGKKYAELLGHQNQKQKIRHVVKIKEENLGLKQELAKLRAQVAKLQRKNLASRPDNFNPADAFQHKKRKHHAIISQSLNLRRYYQPPIFFHS